MLVFLIIIGIIVIAAIPGARRKIYFERTGKCPRCKGSNFRPVAQAETYKGTTVSNRVRLVCIGCGLKI